MAGYTRNDTSNNIATGNVINAADLDGEFDALVAAFHASTGHTHDGTAANGAPITKIGPAQDLVISTGAITPKTDNTVDLGSSSFEFKDLYIDGTANIDALVADTADINAGTIDGTAIGANSASTGAFTTLSASSTVTLSGGTANGVLYLNGSKVATSGSALTFDGTTATVNSGTNNTGLVVSASNSSSSQVNIGVGVLTAGRPFVGTNTNTNPLEIGTRAAADTVFVVNSTEQMRLTSTGLGIGTSSPAYKLDVNDGTCVAQIRSTTTSAGSIPKLRFEHAGNDAFSIVGGTYMAWLSSDTTERMRLDSSGNLGLGVTPSAWGTAKAFQIGGSGFALSSNGAGSGDGSLIWNGYYNGTNWIYSYTGGVATRYRQNESGHAWYTAPSGTAGNAITFTQAMTLDASGNLGVGTTSPGSYGRFAISSTGTPTTAYLSIFSGTGTYNAAFESTLYLGAARTDVVDNGVVVGWRVKTQSPNSSTGAYLAFESANSATGAFAPPSTYTERARITSGGKFLIGTASSVGTLTVDAVDAISTGNSSTYAITCGNDVADGLAFGSDASYAYIQSFSSKSIVINKEGNEVLVAGTTDNGAYNLQCNGTGVWGAGAYVNGSDERLKDNIQTLNDGLAVVSQLRPVTFQYKPEHSKDQSVQPGFIAQELQQAMDGKAYLDGVVQSGPEYLNVAYQNLIPILTKAIQEQQALITSLTARVALLEGN